MTAPRWIAEAIDSAFPVLVDARRDRLANHRRSQRTTPMVTTTKRPHVIEAAVLRALSGGLGADDCKALSAEEAGEVARRLIEESKRLRGASR